MLSRLYENRPALLQALIGELTENGSIQIGPTIRQQRRLGKGTIPDGELHQPSFRLIVETKAGAPWEPEQLIGHLNAFKGEDAQVLLLLSEEVAPPRVIDSVKALSLQRSGPIQIDIVSVTFDDLIRGVREIVDERDFELADVLEDFEAYASEEGLLPTREFTLRTVPAGTSYEENLALRLYYERADRGFRSHTYFGIYTEKAIRQIGKVSKIIIPEVKGGKVESFASVTGTNVDPPDGDLTSDEKDRIQTAVQQAKSHSWDISSGCRFTFVDNFYPTDFRKTSSGAARNARYFDLRTIIKDFSSQLPVEMIAVELSDATWT